SAEDRRPRVGKPRIAIGRRRSKPRHLRVYFEGLGRTMKPLLLILGFLAAVLIIAQLVMGLLILQGQASMRTAHQHSGYLTVAVTLIYIAWSLATIASMPKRRAP